MKIAAHDCRPLSEDRGSYVAENHRNIYAQTAYLEEKVWFKRIRARIPSHDFGENVNYFPNISMRKQWSFKEGTLQLSRRKKTVSIFENHLRGDTRNR